MTPTQTVLRALAWLATPIACVTRWAPEDVTTSGA
jgi:hypothetical protein